MASYKSSVLAMFWPALVKNLEAMPAVMHEKPRLSMRGSLLWKLPRWQQGRSPHSVALGGGGFARDQAAGTAAGKTGRVRVCIVTHPER